MKSVQQLTSVFNIPEIEDEEVDYRRLYQKEKRMRAFYERKARDMQGKLRAYMRENCQLLGRNRPQDMHQKLQEIKSFKSLLPYSIHDIPLPDSDRSLQRDAPPPLLKEWAIYGIAEEQLAVSATALRHEGTTLNSNSSPTQILQHTARLVFPSGTSAKRISGREAHDYSLEIINLSKQKLKTFVLAFEPASFQRSSNSSQNQPSPQLEIIGMLNPERRVYAICMQVEDFTLISPQNDMIELKTPRNKSQRTVKFKELPQRLFQELTIAVSKRVYCIFSNYPFFSFFQELLRTLFYAVKVERYIRYKEGGENLRMVDSKQHSAMLKGALQELKKQAQGKPLLVGKLLDFSVLGSNKVYLQVSRESLMFSLAQEWSYLVLSLFTLDVFLDLLTLLMLEEKIVFVCSDATVLTYAIFLFTKVLIRPFQYPYPVVNLIPDQEEYLNAPFPLVYGYLKQKQDLIADKIPKRYKNVYVFFEPTGVEILSQQDKRKVLSKKSPRLRDRLISKFKKMQKNFPATNFFPFMQKKTVQFSYPTNKELAREIISEVYNYIEGDIFRLLPTPEQVQNIKLNLATLQNIDDDDINQQIFLKIKEEYSNRSKDPFYSALLDTQLLNVHIFKY